MYAPLAIELQDRECLVVGGGEVAFRKAGNLLKYGASVTVVAPLVCANILNMEGHVRIIRRQVRPEDIGAWYVLVCAATDRPEVNRTVRDECARRGIWVNVADQSAPSSFLFPAVLDQGVLQVAVTTAGTSPGAARHIRDRIAGDIGEEYRVFLELMGELRSTVIERHSPDERREVFEAMIGSAALSLIREALSTGEKGPLERARHLMRGLAEGGPGI